MRKCELLQYCDLDAHFLKMMMVARAAERFTKDGGIEGGNTEIEEWNRRRDELGRNERILPQAIIEYEISN